MLLTWTFTVPSVMYSARAISLLLLPVAINLRTSRSLAVSSVPLMRWASFEAIADGKPRLLNFGVSDTQAWEVELACGGKVEVFVDRLE